MNKRKLRVGILSYSLTELRGGTKLALILGNELKKAGCEVAYSCVEEDIKTMEKFFGDKYSFKVYKPKKTFLSNISVHYTSLWNHKSSTNQMLDEFKPDVVIEIGGVITSLLPVIKRKIPTIHYVVFPTSAYADINNKPVKPLPKLQLKFFRIIEKILIKKISKLVCMGNFTQGVLKNIWGVSPTTINPPIDTKRFKPTKKKNIIFSVCRYDSVYKLEKVISYFRKLKNKNYELHLTAQLTAQDKPYYTKLKNSLKKNEKIYLHHDISSKKLIDLYKKSKIFVYSSWSHYGFIFVEAQSAGSPVIAFGKDSGAGEILVNGKSGFVVETFEEFEKSLNKLVNDPKLLTKMSKESIKNSKRFDLEAFRNKFMKEIKELVN